MHPHLHVDLLTFPGLIVSALAAIAIAGYGDDIAWFIRCRWTLERPATAPWTWRARRRWYAPGSVVGIGDDRREALVIDWTPLDGAPHAVVQVHALAQADDDHCRWVPLTDLTRTSEAAAR